MSCDILLTTIVNRPYVVAFLISYLFIAWKIVGPRWTILYLLCGYTIAFTSEYLSINYGFPYGWYFYKYENLAGEWLNHGVPVWDSASYVFMCFAGLVCATQALSKCKNGQAQGPAPTKKFKLVLLSAFFTTLLDVIVDPVAHLGRLWFLGDIYYYPNPGPYFDVTLSNFAGWFLTSACINFVGIFVLGFQRRAQFNPLRRFLGLGLYFGIFGFGLSIAIYLQAWSIVFCDLVWLALIIGILKFGHNKTKTSHS